MTKHKDESFTSANSLQINTVNKIKQLGQGQKRQTCNSKERCEYRQSGGNKTDGKEMREQ